ncbi:MAG: RIP metalloprotease RseP [Rhodocyclaceae bacterium]|nr:RIP metalloprotease RseP [Rhodocyclaceae bacterium]
MNAPVTLGAFLLALGILIVVHEFGHFLAARLCGVKVLRFCVGFGKPILSRRLGADGTEWALAAFPLGGYVKMLDEREGEVASGEAGRAFNRQSLLKRSLIVVAGPLANLLLAVVLYFALFVHGVEELRPIVSAPPAHTLAAAAGFQDGETIVKFDGEAVESWQQLRWRILQNAGQPGAHRLETLNGRGEITDRAMDFGELSTDDPEADPLAPTGLRPYHPPLAAVVGQVSEGSAGAAAGMKAGDRVLAVQGKKVADWRDMVAAVRASPGRAVPMEVERQGQRLVLSVVPVEIVEQGQSFGRIGVAAAPLPAEERARLLVTVRYPLPEAMGKAVALTWETSTFSLAMMGRMVTGSLSWRNLSGPVTIADYAGQSARMGTSAYLKFLALISISLGVLNLLPIPLLDGGHLLYHTAEAIKGGPLSERALEFGQRLGFGVLVLLMAFALYNDISRLFSS